VRPDLVVRGGTVVLESGELAADVLIRGGRVAALTRHGELDPGTTPVLDAAGCLVLPGGVDVHTHIGVAFGEFRTRDDMGSATRAAAFGGTTTLLEFAFPEPRETPAQAVRRRIGEAAGAVWTDVGFHAALIREAGPAALGDVETAARLGCPSVKVFTAYRGLMMLELGDILAVMHAASRARSLVMVHAETESLVERAMADLRRAGGGGSADHPRARPAAAELDAARSVLALAGQAGAAVYLVHVTLPEVAEEIGRARAAGIRAFGETCPHYLLLDESVYRRPHPERFVCSPPLRPARAAHGLWCHLGHELTGVHSDHCCWDAAQKAVNAHDSALVPPGLPGVETRLPLMVSAALQGRLALAEVVRLCAAEPARLFGMPGKGSLLPGMDADLVVLDPAPRGAIGELHMPTDCSPFAGADVRGRVECVVAAGRVLVQEGGWAAERPGGRFLRRRRRQPARAARGPD
jgi:dihydropyrimidinase